ncbi:hypothetical protein E3E23_06370 [Thermococcus sp. CX2]|uniref:hypothetical protein n=1 Tax=Thermococcus sp. CX2 TaxID=163006 RepID=UPI00143C6119|nr:hypothetical protein [Thermococcus sp. CX2]NJE85447.1 hypothetical protein [Thermococcus sp. CX2]
MTIWDLLVLVGLIIWLVELARKGKKFFRPAESRVLKLAYWKGYFYVLGLALIVILVTSGIIEMTARVGTFMVAWAVFTVALLGIGLVVERMVRNQRCGRLARRTTIASQRATSEVELSIVQFTGFMLAWAVGGLISYELWVKPKESGRIRQ